MLAEMVQGPRRKGYSTNSQVKTVRGMTGCFRHQMLLCRHRQSLILDNEQDPEVNKCKRDFLRCRKNNWRREDFP
jgi:hypothetical protein